MGNRQSYHPKRTDLYKRGESLFLRKLVLGIPAQASGKNLTRPLMPSAPQPSCVRATSPHHRKLGAGYVALPQMTGRRFGKPFILSPPTLALRFRQNNGPTPTGDYQPSRSLSMADSGGVNIVVKLFRQLEINNPPILQRFFVCLWSCCVERIASYVTEAIRSKTDKKASKVGGLFVARCLKGK